MKNKLFLLPLLLALVCFFLAGVKYGQKVTLSQYKSQKGSALSMSPSPSTTKQKVQFTPYRHTKCAIQFLILDEFRIINETTSSATLETKHGDILIDCAHKQRPPTDAMSISSSAQISEVKVSSIKNNGNKVAFIRQNKSTDYIFIKARSEIMPLILDTLRANK